MKSQLLKLPALGSLLATVLFAREAAQSAPSEKPAVDTKVAEASPIPQSVFVVSAKKVDGRDPFFPTSTRLEGKVVILSTNKAPAVELTLNGLSGTPENPLAIINNKTFAVGETNEISFSGSRLQVHCLEIRKDSVVVEINGNGERKVLSYRDK